MLHKRCEVFNDPGLLTCYSNDYGYENAVEKFVVRNISEDDICIFVSSSGESKNVIKTCENIVNPIITFTGFEKYNSIWQLGNVNFWFDSKNYNIVETVHSIWLMSIIEYMKG
jgi:D-sedoheptulose 7-phosphate isomerase